MESDDDDNDVDVWKFVVAVFLPTLTEIHLRNLTFSYKNKLK